MPDFLKHSVEWLLLVIPGLLFAGGVGWLLRGWLNRSFWHFLGAWLGGLVAIFGLSFGFVYLFLQWLEAENTTCLSSENYYTCTYNDVVIAYPIIIGLIAFGLYLVLTILWGISRLFRKGMMR